MNGIPDVTFIVSAYDRPDYLRCCLSSLVIQHAAAPGATYEVIVTDNSPDGCNRAIAESFNFRCPWNPIPPHFLGVSYLHTKAQGPYSAAEMAVKQAKGDFLCFPSDDNYYVPQFAKKLLTVAWINEWWLVYPDMIYDPRSFNHFKYVVVLVHAAVTFIDKGGFLVKRRIFEEVGGFPNKKPDYCTSDGEFCEAAARLCGRQHHGKVSEILWFHG